ncbi:hypothetical protein [Saccharopolyspora spinosa]|uniref:hypothetical protein n=1 Tax=Saccharopolyspora spinosa TaxID=60894 RepID=UPI00031BCB21|nr:hypothetical protein [Saccharopolyspora spinosa]
MRLASRASLSCHTITAPAAYRYHRENSYHDCESADHREEGGLSGAAAAKKIGIAAARLSDVERG